MDKLDGRACAEWARANYSLERVSLMYEEFFQQILNIRDYHKTAVGPTGFYERHPGRTQLDWLVKVYPKTATEITIDLTRPHEAPTPPSADLSAADEWTEAQKFESDWWGLEWNARWDEEIKKQRTYHRLMGIDRDDFGAAEILDVGCGPVSLLQRTKHGPSRGVDPLPMNDTTKTRYREAHVELLNVPAEEMPLDRTFDEVWMYNCLQHTRDPNAILRRIAAVTKPGTSVRIFEWLDMGVVPGHPQNLNELLFANHFIGKAWSCQIWNVGTVKDAASSEFGKYIALHVVRKAASQSEVVHKLSLR